MFTLAYLQKLSSFFSVATVLAKSAENVDFGSVAFGLSFVLIAFGLVTGPILLFVKAPYGKFAPSSNRTPWGPLIPAKYAWFLQEIPAFILPILIAYSLGIPTDTASRVLLSLFLIHYLQRSLIYPFMFPGARPMPLSVCFMAFTFCCVNGVLQGVFWCGVKPNIPLGPLFFLGVAMWIFGFLGNLHSDHILRSLRKPGEMDYKIPHGGLFRFVSCGNYFAELLEWCGYAVASGPFLPPFAFALVTACNLIPRALDQHRFYCSKFENYPRRRKAIVPFLL